MRTFTQLATPIFDGLFPKVPGSRPTANSVFVYVSTGLLNLSGTTAPVKLGTVGRLRRLGARGSSTDSPVVVFLYVGTSKLALVPISVVACQTRVKTTGPTSIFLPLVLTAFSSALITVLTIYFGRQVGVLRQGLLLFFNKVVTFVNNLTLLFKVVDRRSISLCSALFTGVLLFSVVYKFVVDNVHGGVGMCSAFVRNTGRNFRATIAVVPCLVTMLITVTIFQTSKTVSFLVSNVHVKISTTKLSARFIRNLPAVLVGPLDNDKTQNVVLSTVGACNTSSFVNHLYSVIRKSDSAAFCIITLCFNDIKVHGACCAVPYSLLTSLTKTITTIAVACLFFAWCRGSAPAPYGSS